MITATYKLDQKRLTRAKLARLFHSSFLTSIHKIMVGLGVAAGAGLIIDFGFGLGFTVFLAPLWWLMVLLGLIFFVGLNFRAYLTASELAVPISGDNVDLGQSADYGATIFLSGLGFPSLDMGKFIKKIATTPEVTFVLSEMAPPERFWSDLKAGSGGAEYPTRVFAAAVERAIEHGSPLVSCGDIFYGLISESANYQEILTCLELEESDLSNIFFLQSKLFRLDKYRPNLTDRLKVHTAGVAESWDTGYTNFLDRFSHQIGGTVGGEFSVEGRERIVAEMENILTKKSKNNLVLCGPVGVGKTTVIRGLASKIAWGNSLEALSYARVLELDLGAIIARAGDRAELEAVMMGILNDAVRAGNVILYIPEIHDLFAGGTKEGTIDATEIILPYLRDSGVRVIGSTTDKYFQTYIESKPELAALFTKIPVEPTDKTETVRVMAEMSVYLGREYGAAVTYRALKEVYLLAEKFVTEKEFPGKAVDMLENILTAARNEKVSRVDRAEVARLAERDLNVKVAEATRDEKEVLLNLEAKIHSRVVGQFAAVTAVADAMRRARTNVKNDHRPVGSFLFLGPTGVGKTELAKSLAASYYGDEKKMIRMDMNEFQDTDAISRFIGKKAAGGEELEGGEFVKHLRSNPATLVLLDEIEKAHPNILDLFLQALDEGYLTDGMGERVVLSAAIIIATSNAGANLVRKMVEEKTEYAKMREQVLEAIQNSGTFKPEFLNRFDGVIVFAPLSGSEILKVAELMYGTIQKDFAAKGYQIELEPGLLEKLAQEGYVPEMGARPMRRVFQDRLENYLAKAMLSGGIEKGKPFVVRMTDLYQ